MPTIRAKQLAEELVLECNRYMLETDEDYEPSDGYYAVECAKDTLDEIEVGSLPHRGEPDYCVECRGKHSHRDNCSSGNR